MRITILASIATLSAAGLLSCGRDRSPDVSREPPPTPAETAPAPQPVPVPAPATAPAEAERTGPPGLATVKSERSFVDTAKTLEALIGEKGLKLMAKVDHAKNAKGVGMELRPTTLFIFGNPKAGSQLMAQQQSIAIDLPMKMLVWQAEDGSVHLGYNRPAHLAQRHQLTGKEELLAKMEGMLSAIAAGAAKKQ